jgi:signal transduction histidine kinase
VLEISRGDEQDKGVEMTSQLCNPMLQRAIDDFCKKTGNNVEQFHLETELPEDFVIHSNDDVLRRILNPLLDNAVKNASKEKVILRASILNTHIEGKRGSKKNSPHLVIAVEDNGPGIPVEEAEHIFDEFVQLDEYYDGTGIGLTVARSFARRLGGDVKLDTTYTAGARFVMTLPRK